ncbi:MAG TPA: protein kinase [Vicinamibacterales bacterium]|jgi:Tol biopolymer transport system component|nr:protein kinase [Vicinamibacterales bacterium]
MKFAPGFRLGPYEIKDRIGAGGMGEVYRARDTRLDRTVAIKVLSEDFEDLPELRQRFEREARAVAALSHPNICTLYDIGWQGVDYLVIEYLEGETLAARIARGPLKLDEALAIATQIADALDKAHRHGVVHRDLKPGNIMLTKSGSRRDRSLQAKLLDFGLAKLAKPSVSFVANEKAHAAVPERALTAEGTILGTLEYMAPEQLEGREADTRSDIFAFGSILYEMIAGKRVFEGKTDVSLIAAIAGQEPPPLSSLAPLTPPLVDHLVKVCLAKHPDHRWQSMADVLIQLKLIVDSGGKLDPPAAERARSVKTAVASAAALALLIGAGVALRTIWPPPSAGRSRITFDLPTPIGLSYQFAVSPNGSHIAAHVAEKGGLLWLRALEHANGQTIAGTDGGQWPFWSPDGRFIAFFGGGKLKKIAIGGGTPQTLCEASNGLGGAWNRHDVIVFAPGANGPLFRVPATGGVAAAVTELDKSRQEIAHRHPYFLPDGAHFVYLAISTRPENTGIVLASLDSRERTWLLASGARAAFAPPDRLLFMRDDTLMAQRLDLARATFDGDPVPIAEGVGSNTGSGGSGFSVSDDGLLAYRAGTAATRDGTLTWVDRAGVASPASAPVAAYESPRLSANGQQIAVSKDDGKIRNIWLLDVSRGVSTRFTTGAAIDDDPVWSLDGSRIAFRSNRAGNYDLYQKLSNGVAEEELLRRSDHPMVPEAWAPDGRSLVYRDTDPETKDDLWLLPMDGDRKPQPIARSRFNESLAQISPDGRWIAYQSNESGRPEVYVQDFPKPSRRVQISTDRGERPHWRSDGKELLYQSGSAVTAVGIAVDGGALKPGVPRALFQLDTIRGTWDMTADGRRFLMVVPVDRTPQANVPLTIVTNWR